MYLAFAPWTSLEVSLIGIPVGIAVGQATFYASGKRGGRWFQALAVFLAFMAFDLTYAPGLAAVAFKYRVTAPSLVFFVFMTVVSPIIDKQNGFFGLFMVVGGMYLAWTLARARETTGTN